MINKSVSRREFLKGSLAATGLTIAVSVTPLGYRLLNASEKRGSISGFNPNVWFEITPDNVVRITLGSSEMGQGSHTALAMIIADELEADWKQVQVQMGTPRKEFTNPVMLEQITVASSAVRGFYDILREAGAAGRAVLVKAAASTWNVPESECQAFNGTVKHRGSGRSFTYGALCQKAAKLKLPKQPTLKKENEFRYMGKALPRVDIPEKVSGKAIFGLDVNLPDLHYAVLARPPAYGAKQLSSDEKAALAIKGVKKVVPTPDGPAVCAESLDAAWKGRDALNVKWDKGSHPDMDNDYIEKSYMADLDKPGSPAKEKGDAKKAIEGAERKVQATYFLPYVAHTPMEPMNCAAHVQGDRVLKVEPAEFPDPKHRRICLRCTLIRERGDERVQRKLPIAHPAELTTRLRRRDRAARERVRDHPLALLHGHGKLHFLILRQ